jgi:hypothetical protein
MKDPYDFVYGDVSEGSDLANLINNTNADCNSDNKDTNKRNVSRNYDTNRRPSNNDVPSQDTSAGVTQNLSDKTNFQTLKESLKFVLDCVNQFINVVEPLTTLASRVDNSGKAETLLEVVPHIERTKKMIETIRLKTESLQEERGEVVDWNKDFQECVDLPEQTTQQKLYKFEKIREVAQNFVTTAELFGKIIIAEAYVPNKYKTIKPVPELGGFAGGEKYIWNGILFKFAMDWKGLYKSDESAMKAAGHELKSLMQVFNSRIKGLHVPLITLIDYLGFRLVAESILPINRNTIVYGSSDVGKTVHADMDDVNQMMAELGQKLNLEKHIAGLSPKGCKELYTPADIEGHKGKDGRVYIIDFARLMPPTQSDQRFPMSHLFRLFRPEFLKNYKKSLCSDAFSSLIIHDPKKSQYEADIQEATHYLLEEYIPNFAKVLEKKVSKHNEHELIDLIHSAGINLRYLAILWKNVMTPYLRLLLLMEMIARGIKSHLNKSLREHKKSLKAIALEPYYEVILDVFNAILGNSSATKDTSAIFWRQLRKRLESQFEQFPTNELLALQAQSTGFRVGIAIANNCCSLVGTGRTNYAPQLWYQVFFFSHSNFNHVE